MFICYIRPFPRLSSAHESRTRKRLYLLEGPYHRRQVSSRSQTADDAGKQQTIVLLSSSWLFIVSDFFSQTEKRSVDH